MIVPSLRPFKPIQNLTQRRTVSKLEKEPTLILLHYEQQAL